MERSTEGKNMESSGDSARGKRVNVPGGGIKYIWGELEDRAPVRPHSRGVPRVPTAGESQAFPLRGGGGGGGGAAARAGNAAALIGRRGAPPGGPGGFGAPAPPPGPGARARENAPGKTLGPLPPLPAPRGDQNFHPRPPGAPRRRCGRASSGGAPPLPPVGVDISFILATPYIND